MILPKVPDKLVYWGVIAGLSGALVYMVRRPGFAPVVLSTTTLHTDTQVDENKTSTDTVHKNIDQIVKKPDGTVIETKTSETDSQKATDAIDTHTVADQTTKVVMGAPTLARYSLDLKYRNFSAEVLADGQTYWEHPEVDVGVRMGNLPVWGEVGYDLSTKGVTLGVRVEF